MYRVFLEPISKDYAFKNNDKHFCSDESKSKSTLRQPGRVIGLAKINYIKEKRRHIDHETQKVKEAQVLITGSPSFVENVRRCHSPKDFKKLDKLYDLQTVVQREKFNQLLEAAIELESSWLFCASHTFELEM